MENKVVLIEKNDGIALITISRPEALNSLNAEVFSGLKDAIEDAKNDNSIRVVILTGAGEKSFVAGTDIKMMESAVTEDNRKMCTDIHDLFFQIENLEKPVIAAINGYALGGGCELTLTCDFRIASENAKFAFPEVSLGIIPGSGGTQRLPGIIGKSRAKYMILTSERINADKALEYGLVDFVVPQNELISKCNELANKLMKQPALALALGKRAVNLASEVDLQSGIAYETEAFAVAFGSDAKKERMAAFVASAKK